MIGAKTIRRALAKRGLHVLPEWRLTSFHLGRHLQALFTRYSIDCVFDVGANQGQYAKFVRELGFAGPIVSFEPVSKYVAVLGELAARDGNWRICPYALGAEAATANITVTVSPGLNSFLEPMVDNGYWPPSPCAGTEEVTIKTLNQVFPELKRELGFAAPYLKIDTQGFDLEVMRGAGGALAEFYALQTEASVVPMYEGMPSYRKVLDFVTEAGFSLSGMFPVGVDADMRLIEFDCVAVRSQ